jgi:tRNA pseudouridine38-40 synthase
MERRFYALRLWYDGGRFRGFQRQPGLPTVQEALEDALRRALRQGASAPGAREVPSLVVAARTDAGVHAVGQVVSFSMRAALDPDALRRALNATLPEGLAVLEAWAARAGFHARSAALSRTYVYLVGVDVPAPLRAYAWSLPDARAFPGLGTAAPALTDTGDGAHLRPGDPAGLTTPAAPLHLDPAGLRAALSLAVGEHDFAGFARPGEQRGTVRTLLSAEVVSANWAPLHAIVLTGKGFLRAMVRNLVGTAVTAAVGLAPASHLGELLLARGRYRGVRAPGWGLTLANVAYPPGTAPPSPPKAP